MSRNAPSKRGRIAWHPKERLRKRSLKYLPCRLATNRRIAMDWQRVTPSTSRIGSSPKGHFPPVEETALLILFKNTFILYLMILDVIDVLRLELTVLECQPLFAFRIKRDTNIFIIHPGVCENKSCRLSPGSEIIVSQLVCRRHFRDERTRVFTQTKWATKWIKYLADSLIYMLI